MLFFCNRKKIHVELPIDSVQSCTLEIPVLKTVKRQLLSEDLQPLNTNLIPDVGHSLLYFHTKLKVNLARLMDINLVAPTNCPTGTFANFQCGWLSP